MELQNINDISDAARHSHRELHRIGIALLFIIIIMLYTISHSVEGNHGTLLIIAAMIGGYMAMNIGANDVANNVGPAVGSKALTMGGAILIAATFEASGALIAGGDVVSTIKKGIIDPAGVIDADTFVWMMMAALLAAAIWLNIATALGTPVSTTHSIVGGVLGAGIAAGGIGIANWDKMGAIVASWVISPLLGGLIAALLLYLIKRFITYHTDMLNAAKIMVPVFVAFMVWTFSTYLILKGLNKIWQVDFVTAAGIGFMLALIAFVIVEPLVINAAAKLSNDKESVNSLFTLPLIFSAALLSFAHGANDVANAVGPLAAINEVISSGSVVAIVAIPLWVMMIGAIGIAIGLTLYGPRLIKTMGSDITELNKMRAFCVAMAASITVIIASQLGLPVSSTHIAVGAILGVGFLREYLKASYGRVVEEIKHHHESENPEEVEVFLLEFKKASLGKKQQMLYALKMQSAKANLTKKERKQLKKFYNTELVKRSHIYRIIAAWLITVPVSGIMAALLFFTIRGMMVV